MQAITIAKPIAYRSSHDRRRRPRTNDRMALTLDGVSEAPVSSATWEVSASVVIGLTPSRAVYGCVVRAVGVVGVGVGGVVEVVRVVRDVRDDRAVGQPDLACARRQGEVGVMRRHDHGAAVVRVPLTQQRSELKAEVGVKALLR